MYKGSAVGFKKEHPAALISTLQRAFASQWDQTWQCHVNPGLTPPFGCMKPPAAETESSQRLEVNRSGPLQEAGPRLPGGKWQSEKINCISRMLGKREVLAKRVQAGPVPRGPHLHQMSHYCG